MLCVICLRSEFGRLVTDSAKRTVTEVGVRSCHCKPRPLPPSFYKLGILSSVQGTGRLGETAWFRGRLLPGGRTPSPEVKVGYWVRWGGWEYCPFKVLPSHRRLIVNLSWALSLFDTCAVAMWSCGIVACKEMQLRVMVGWDDSQRQGQASCQPRVR